ncbi:hypothetical protein AMATHDRAFT_143256 [Amanita thiersii Skay4041]|uniref:DNA-(apurinic or apyrimidinic site) lyase n=1 Tax=Amanita thiersii Skay4041 TaxID=703135 RepID=A0A2A9NU46_9AGAR|nr:hypothetical protein AMATHDRAFT_143256 [Amanita thiersii Skay4041]
MASVTLSSFQSLPISVLQVSLAAVLNCGQSFRWTSIPLGSNIPPTHEYRLCLRDRIVCLRQTPDTLYYRAVYPNLQATSAQHATRKKETLDWLRDYLQLDVDLQRLYQEWAAKDQNFAGLKDRFGGIRILRQDPWENLISFICSSNNNIARITKMVHSLCKQFSPPLLSLETLSGGEQEAYHPFPPPSVLAAPEVASTLRSLGFGYRANFIQRTASMLVEAHGNNKASANDSRELGEKWLASLRNKGTAEAREELLKFVGVGRKVADCVLLMSLDKKEVIPVDTHVHQLAIKYYGMKGSTKGKTAMTPKIYDEVSSKLQALWGDYAGWAHSVMFTSDLKSFSTYGLPGLPEPNAPLDEPASPTKRKRSQDGAVSEAISDNPVVLTSNDLISGVKRRRRTVRVVYVLKFLHSGFISEIIFCQGLMS